MSVGLIDDGAVVACNGVTECDQAIIATAIPIPMVPVEKKTLRMTAFPSCSFECCDDGPVAFQDFAVTFKKWCRAKFVCFVGDPECRRRFREKLRMKQPH